MLGTNRSGVRGSCPRRRDNHPTSRKGGKVKRAAIQGGPAGWSGCFLVHGQFTGWCQGSLPWTKCSTARGGSEPHPYLWEPRAFQEGRQSQDTQSCYTPLLDWRCDDDQELSPGLEAWYREQHHSKRKTSGSESGTLILFPPGSIYLLYDSARTTVIKSHRQGGRDNRNSCLTILEAGSPRPRCCRFCSWEEVPRGLQTAPSCCVLMWRRGKDRTRSLTTSS